MSAIVNAVPTIDASEAYALRCTIRAYVRECERITGMGLPTDVERVAMLALQRICPHPEKDRAEYAGLPSRCACCEKVLVVEAAPV
jgi:hypothetical protein